MRRHMAGAAALAVFAAIGSAGQAAAADQWIMPTTKGLILQRAVDAVHDVTGDAPVKFYYVPRHVNQDVINLTNWTVCSSSPGAGKVISQKSKKVTFSVRRPNEKC